MITKTTIKNPTFKMAVMQATYKSLQSMRKYGKALAVNVFNAKGVPVLQIIVDIKGRAHVLCLKSKRFITETVAAGIVL